MNQGIDSTLTSLEARWRDIATQYLIHPVGVEKMTQVVLGENEGIESALRRFKRQVSKAGILADARKNRHFETPIEKRRRKAVAKRRKKQFRY